MPKVTIVIEDIGDEVTMQGTVEPEITADKAVFTTAEVIGLYLQQHAGQIMSAAIKWAQMPDEPIEPSQIILPGGGS